MNKAQLVMISGLMSIYTGTQAQAAGVWHCETDGGSISIGSQQPLLPNQFAPKFAKDHPVSVSVTDASGETEVYPGKVVSQHFKGITKHAPMATYTVVVDDGKMKGTLGLILLGIDEFENRHQCGWTVALHEVEAQARAKCPPDAAPACFGRDPLGSTYITENDNGYTTTLSIGLDGTTTLMNPTWGHPGGDYVYSRVSDFAFEILFFRYGAHEPQHRYQFQIEDEGRTLLQYREGVLIHEFKREDNMLK